MMLNPTKADRERTRIFNTVYNHLLKQGKQSLHVRLGGNIDGCAYRGWDGSKCAIGCLINDEHYSFILEEYTISNEFIRQAIIKSGFNLDDIDMDMLIDLVYVHDSIPVHQWQDYLDRFSDKWKILAWDDGQFE